MAVKVICFYYDETTWDNLFPFSQTRSILDFRIGITTIREKWQEYLPFTNIDDEDYVEAPVGEEITLGINKAVLPDQQLIAAINRLRVDEQLVAKDGTFLCDCFVLPHINGEGFRIIQYEGDIRKIEAAWHIFEHNIWAIKEDFQWVTKNRKVQTPSATNQLINPGQVFVEEGATVECCIINASQGPVFIAKGAEVMEGSLLRGPVAIGENAVVKMGSKIYGGTTIGPNCVAGGEIKNCVFFGNSNKAHDGYLGDSVIGEWCNMGAGTSNSNIKNTASDVTVYMPHGSFNAGLKCGVLMGDYTRTAINTSINTGTVTGVCCNIFNPGLTPKYIPSFSWGTMPPQIYRLDKAMADIDAWMQLKGQRLTDAKRLELKHIFEQVYPSEQTG